MAETTTPDVPGAPRGWWNRRSTAERAAIIGGVGAIVAAVIPAGLGLVGPDRRPSPKPTHLSMSVPVVRIHSPRNGIPFEGDELTVEGFASGLGEGQSLWCFVLDENQRWYPYPAPVSSDGSWRSTISTGPDRVLSHPLPFALHMVVADRQAAEHIDTVRAGSDRQDYIGMDQLPPGATSLTSRITTRVR